MANTPYLQELKRRLTKQGYTTAEEPDGSLAIGDDSGQLCRINAKGQLLYPPQENDTQERIDSRWRTCDEAEYVAEYVSAVENSPPLRIEGLAEQYKKLCDFGDYVLAGKARPNGGYEFVTWQYSYQKTGVTIGHYFEDDYRGAKEDFALRCGLIAEEKRFDDEQLTEIYRFLQPMQCGIFFRQNRLLISMVNL